MAQVRVVLKSVFDDKGLKNAQAGFQKIGLGIDKAFRAVTIGVGVASAAVAKFGVDAIKQASNLEESTNAVNVAFRDAARGVLAIGESSAESLGIARSEFNQAAVRFSAFAERVVGQGGDVAGFIQEITTRAADFASVFNIDVAEALQVFQSGLSGEAEPLKRFGINLLDTEVKAYAVRSGMIAMGQSMTEAEKVQARYGLLMESTNKTAGDFANTSDSLANQQRILNARFTDLQAEIGGALLPAVTQLVGQVADRLLPAFEEFGQFLNSPQGKKVIEDTAKAISDFFIFIVENLDTIVDLAVKVAALVTALKLLKGALELATIAQTLFNVAVRANPYVIAATALISLAGGMALVADYAAKAQVKADKQAQSVGALQEEARRLSEAFQDGLIPQDKYEAKMNQIQDAIRAAGGSVEGTIGELNRLNNIRLDKLNGQLKDSAGELNRFANIAKSILPKVTTGGGGGGGGGTGESAAEKAAKERAEAFKRVQKLIKDSQKDIQAAQRTYGEAVTSIQKEYAENVLRTEKDFAKRLADIVQQSQDRLRSAFASVVRVSLADLFEVEETRSVANLVKGLTDRLAKSKTLLENAGKLNAAGFSQQFIEQIVSAGVETGNELAGAILASTPETQAELQKLFNAVETTADTGMDSLAAQIYEKAGLATNELKALYADTQQQLADALLELQLQLNIKLQDANQTFIDSIVKVREKLTEEIAEMEGKLGGLTRTYEQFLQRITQLQGEAQARVTIPTPSISSPSATNPIIPTPQIQTLPSPRPVVADRAASYNISVNAGLGTDGQKVGQVIVDEIKKFERQSGRVFLAV